MGTTTEYHMETVTCPKCGKVNQVPVVTDYDTEEEDFTIDVVGYEACECGYVFTAENLDI